MATHGVQNNAALNQVGGNIYRQLPGGDVKPGLSEVPKPGSALSHLVLSQSQPPTALDQSNKRLDDLECQLQKLAHTRATLLGNTRFELLTQNWKDVPSESLLEMDQRNQQIHQLEREIEALNREMLALGGKSRLEALGFHVPDNAPAHV